MMWNPSSDNNKAEDAFIAGTTDEHQHQQQQQQMNIVDNNKSITQQQQSNIADNGKQTKTTTLEGESSSSSYGGGGGFADSSGISCSGGVDSGFLSGPQLVEDYLEDDNLKKTSASGGRNIPSVKLNIVNKQQFTEDYQDSGCIDEELIDEEEHQQYQKKPSITTTAATPQTQQRTIVRTQGTEPEEGEYLEDVQMILDSGVDAGVSEWFCKLRLEDPSQQLNNLGAASQKQSQNVNTNNRDMRDPPSWMIYYEQNNEGDTQLHLACSSGYVEVVAALIRIAPHPCLFNIQNDEAQTALHLTVLCSQPKMLRMLLIAGAAPTVRDRNGNTPLHLACMSGDIQCVKALTIPISASEINEAHRSYGHLSSDKTTSYLDCAHLPADLEIRNYDGERCVHLAAQGGHTEILRHLVWFGADINAREGKSGRTALHIAIECCNEILANFLLEECSKLNLETATYAGLTAYQVACILNNSTMQNHLEKRGAEPLTPPDSDYESSDIETDLDDSQMYDRFGDPRFFANYNGGNPINVA